MSTDEQHFLDHVGGYVLKKIHTKYQHKTDDISHQFVSLVKERTMQHQDTDCSREDVLAYTRQWFSIVNRGGIYPINDVAFLFFVDVEKAVQCTLP